MKHSNLINGQKPEFGNLEQIKVLQNAERKIADEAEYKELRKNMNPLEKYIDDQMNVGWVFYCIDEYKNKLIKRLSGRDPLTVMIDQCTGYEKGLIKGFLLHLKDGYKQLVKLFKRLGEDEQKQEYEQLLAKINESLKTDYKKVKICKI